MKETFLWTISVIHHGVGEMQCFVEKCEQTAVLKNRVPWNTLSLQLSKTKLFQRWIKKLRKNVSPLITIFFRIIIVSLELCSFFYAWCKYANEWECKMDKYAWNENANEMRMQMNKCEWNENANGWMWIYRVGEL